jgi:hypothetical protein
MITKTKHQLRAQLVNNPLADARSPQLIARPLPEESMTRKEILAYIVEKNPGLEPEAIGMVFDLTMSAMEELLLDGKRLNTSLFSAGVAYSGTIEKGAWNPAVNKAYIHFNQSRHIAREIEKHVHVKITSNSVLPIYIVGIDPDSAAYVGANNAVRMGYFVAFVGKNIKVAGDHPDVGVTLRNLQTDAVTRIEKQLFAQNAPSRLTLMIPTELPEGDYELTVTTQFKGTSQLLLSPRSTTLPLRLVNPGGEE